MSNLKFYSSIILNNCQPFVLLERIEFTKKSIIESSEDVCLTLASSKSDTKQVFNKLTRFNLSCMLN